MNTTTLPLKHSINRGPFRLVLLLIPLALVCFALAPQARAVCQKGCDLVNFNTFLGDGALVNNTTGTDNTAIGAGALTSNTTGFDNTATGTVALEFNTDGSGNTATGAFALFLNTSGTENTAVGGGALVNNTTGGANTAVGFDALRASNGNFNTALGFFAGQNLSSDNNIAVGYLAGQYLSGDNNIDIGNQGGADDSGVIRIGTTRTHTATFVAGIRGVPITGGQEVGVNASGQLGVRPSSARFKEAINSMAKSSEAILALRPVEFRYKKELDPKGAPQFGLIAEEVAKLNPGLVVADDQGKPFSVRYEEVNAMLLNEFLKEHRKVEQLEKQVAALTAGLQKVSAQLDVSKSAPQTVLNNH